jgi:hypothetical protein
MEAAFAHETDGLRASLDELKEFAKRERRASLSRSSRKGSDNHGQSCFEARAEVPAGPSADKRPLNCRNDATRLGLSPTMICVDGGRGAGNGREASHEEVHGRGGGVCLARYLDTGATSAGGAAGRDRDPDGRSAMGHAIDYARRPAAARGSRCHL